MSFLESKNRVHKYIGLKFTTKGFFLFDSIITESVLS